MCFTSEEHKGSTFYFSFPTEACLAEPLTHTQQLQRCLMRQNLQERVMVIDSNAVLREVLCYQISSYNLVPMDFPTVAHTIQTLQSGGSFKHSPKLALVDGKEDAQAMQKLTSLGMTVVVLLNPQQHQQHAQFAAFPHIKKPIREKVLSNYLCEFFDIVTPERRPSTDFCNYLPPLQLHHLQQLQPQHLQLQPSHQNADQLATQQALLKILVAEDNTLNQTIIMKTLRGKRSEKIGEL